MNALFAPIALIVLAGNDNYARPQMLVEPTALKKPETAREFRILDARAKEKYEAGHVPGAVWVDHEAWSKAFAAGQDPQAWAKKIGALGIGNATKVLVYDDAKQKDAARIWWILRYWGVKDARLLNGGWTAYQKTGQPVSKTTPTLQNTDFRVATLNAARLADKDRVLGILKDKKVQIIDTRSEGEYCGDDKLKNKRGGHIPGALHLEWSEAIDPQTHRFKSASDLQKLLNEAGIDLARPTVAHCQTGGRSSVMVFTLELMGANDVANYYRGWSEWGNESGTPVDQKKRK